MAEPVGNVALVEALPDTSAAGSIVSGTTWTAAGRLFAQAMQFLAGLVLARLLLPADFGLLASVYLVTGLTVIFFDLGLAGALVYQRDLGEEDRNTAFWLNSLGGAVFVGLLAALGPAIADFFGDARLAYLAPLAGLPFLLGIGMVHSALLTREMRFKELVVAESIGTVVNVGATVAAAALMHDPSALVIGPALGSAAITVLLWRMHPWRPSGFVTGSAVKRLWGFSGGALTFAVTNYFGNNSDNILIGRFIGPAGLGYYNRAFNLMLLPIQQVGGVLGRVLFPAFAAMGGDLERVASAYRRSLRLITTLAFPMLLGLAATAPGLVPILWGPHWSSTIFLMQVLCIAGLPQVLTGTESWLYESQGQTRLMSVVGLITTGVKVASVVVGIHWGVRGVAVGILVSSYACLPFSSCVAYSLVKLEYWRVLRETLAAAGIAGAMAVAAWFVPTLLGMDRRLGAAVLVQVLTGLVVYAVGLALVRRDVLSDGLAVMRRRQPRGRHRG